MSSRAKNVLGQAILAIVFVVASVSFGGSFEAGPPLAPKQLVVHHLVLLHMMLVVATGFTAILALVLELPALVDLGWTKLRTSLVPALESSQYTLVVYTLFVMSIATGGDAVLTHVVDYALAPVVLAVTAWMTQRPNQDGGETLPSTMFLMASAAGAALVVLGTLGGKVSLLAHDNDKMHTHSIILALLSGLMSGPMLRRAKSSMDAGLPPFTGLAVRLLPSVALGLFLYASPELAMPRVTAIQVAGRGLALALPLWILAVGLRRGTLGFAAVTFNLVPAGLFLVTLPRFEGSLDACLLIGVGLGLMSVGLVCRQLAIEWPRKERGARPVVPPRAAA